MTGEVPDDDAGNPVARAFDCCRSGAAAELVDVLATDVAPDATNDKGNSLIMVAAYHGHADACRVLIDRGAAVDALNPRGQTPIAGAVFKDHASVVSVLLAAGADPLRGTPNARDTATFFDRAEILILIDEQLRRRP